MEFHCSVIVCNGRYGNDKLQLLLLLTKRVVVVVVRLSLVVIVVCARSRVRHSVRAAVRRRFRSFTPVDGVVAREGTGCLISGRVLLPHYIYVHAAVPAAP